MERPGNPFTEYSVARKRMVLDQLVARGIRNHDVLNAMERIPRHRFVEEALSPLAYNDHPLSIGQRQTISQPFVVARMLEVLELKKTDRVLEVGTGCGYQSALLATLVGHVYSIERISQLLFKARSTLKQLGFRNISLKLGDGTLGWVRQAPFEAIIVAAAGPRIPQPYLDQLVEGGRMVLPVGDKDQQELIFIRKASGKVIKQKLSGCRFVQLKGKHGFSAA